MTCRDALALAPDRSTLDPATADRVTAHLAACPACAAAAARQEAAVAQLQRLALREPPPGLEARLLSLPRVAPPAPAPVAIAGDRLVWWLAVAATALTAWSIWQARHDRRESVPGGAPLLADAGGPAGARGPAAPGPRAADLPGEAPPAAPTVVARLQPLDLRAPAAPDAVASVGRRAVAGDDVPAAALATRGPRGGLSDAAAATPVSDEGAAASLPPADRDPAPARPRREPDAPAQVAPPQVAPPVLQTQPAPPTAPPATAEACPGPATVRVRVAADVAGGGDAGCPGCDGVAGADDLAALTAAGRRLPSLQIGYYAAGDGPSFEVRVAPGDAAYRSPGEVVVDLPTCALRPEHWPLAVVVRLESDVEAGDWAACPGSGDFMLDRPDAPVPTLLVHPVCPIVPPPTAEPLAGPVVAAGAATDVPEPAGPAPATPAP